MEFFSELYGCYYDVVAKILKTAHKQDISIADINKIVEKEAFAESGLHLIPKLIDGDWAFFQNDDSSGLWRSKFSQEFSERPLTELQRSWLKAILQDKRIRLFIEDSLLIKFDEWLVDSDPLFEISDFHVFDVALDGDPYCDETYIYNFRRILSAIKTQKPIMVEYTNARGADSRMNIIPVNLQYSEKDDKFRVIGGRIRRNNRVVPLTINLARISKVHSSRSEVPPWINIDSLPEKGEHIAEVELHISKERNALERCMTQFAFYEKETKIEENGRGYRCHIRYRLEDETELLIRILSFGPVIKVLGPDDFVAQIKERLKRQLEYRFKK